MTVKEFRKRKDYIYHFNSMVVGQETIFTKGKSVSLTSKKCMILKYIKEVMTQDFQLECKTYLRGDIMPDKSDAKIDCIIVTRIK